MSLLAAHLEAPLNEPTKNPSDSTVWSDSVFPTKAPKPQEDPSTSSFRKGLLRVQHPKMLAVPLSIPKSLQSSKHPKMLADPLSAFEKFQARDCKNSKVKRK